MTGYFEVETATEELAIKARELRAQINTGSLDTLQERQAFERTLDLLIAQANGLRFTTLNGFYSDNPLG